MDMAPEQRGFEEAVLDAVEDAIIVMDMTGQVIRFGRGAVELLGGRPPGAVIWELIPAADRILADRVIAAANEPRPVWVAARMITTSGAWMPVRLTARLFNDEEGRSGYILAAVPALEGIVDAQQEDDRTQALTEMVRSVFHVNHNIRSPLSAIMGNAQLAHRGLGEDQPEIRERLDRIVRLCEKIGILLEEMTEAKRKLLAAVPGIEKEIEGDRRIARADQED